LEPRFLSRLLSTSRFHSFPPCLLSRKAASEVAHCHAANATPTEKAGGAAGGKKWVPGLFCMPMPAPFISPLNLAHNLYFIWAAVLPPLLYYRSFGFHSDRWICMSDSLYDKCPMAYRELSAAHHRRSYYLFSFFLSFSLFHYCFAFTSSSSSTSSSSFRKTEPACVFGFNDRLVRGKLSSRQNTK
jgi:hypothetical protein